MVINVWQFWFLQVIKSFMCRFNVDPLPKNICWINNNKTENRTKCLQKMNIFIYEERERERESNAKYICQRVGGARPRDGEMVLHSSFMFSVWCVCVFFVVVAFFLPIIFILYFSLFFCLSSGQTKPVKTKYAEFLVFFSWCVSHFAIFHCFNLFTMSPT